jgi:hypothetical protein
MNFANLWTGYCKIGSLFLQPSEVQQQASMDEVRIQKAFRAHSVDDITLSSPNDQGMLSHDFMAACSDANQPISAILVVKSSANLFLQPFRPDTRLPRGQFRL